MLCSNCGKNEANFRYTQIINGKKTEYALCEECARKQGIDDFEFSMPLDFSNFFGNFFEEDALLPSFSKVKNKKCSKCGLTFDEFIDSGKFGCKECYNTFSNKLESILRNLNGSTQHTGRIGKKVSNFSNIEVKELKNENNENGKNKIDEKSDKLKSLEEQLKLAIKEERYEEAAKIRDQIKEIK